MKQLVKIGVACIARKTFDYEAAEKIYEQIQSDLKKVEQVDWEFVSSLVIEIDDAKKAAHELARAEVDAFICISGTFALGHLVLEFNKILHRPIMLWGLNELPYDGGKIRLNSVCGVNLNASNLYKAGVKDFYANVGDAVDGDWIDAIRVLKAFNSTHIGLLGYRAKGFFNLDVDELDLYEKTGILVDHFELDSVFSQEVEDVEVAKRKEQVANIFETSKITEDQLQNVATLTAKFDAFMDNNGLTAVAVRCWPEFA